MVKSIDVESVLGHFGHNRPSLVQYLPELFRRRRLLRKAHREANDGNCFELVSHDCRSVFYYSCTDDGKTLPEIVLNS